MQKQFTFIDNGLKTSFNYELFTEREREVIPLIATGLSNEEIAERLYVTNATIKTHLQSIYKKLHSAIGGTKNSKMSRLKLVLYYLKYVGALDSNWYIQ